MRSRKGDVPLTLVRPAIINPSLLEPAPGWIDNLAAASALYFFVGLGIVKHALGDVNKIVDLIPVDVVVAVIILATPANIGNNKLNIYHVASSDLNPYTYGKMTD
jgi:alcohol-forming fatty acyl-CoA reductase